MFCMCCLFCIWWQAIGFSSWKEAVKAMSEELEAVRAIASVTDVVPHTLIGVDKYVHWTENVGSPNCPFPLWKKVLKPDVAEIAGHPWLLTAERRLDPENPTLATAATTPTPPHATPTPTTRDKGKEQPIESSVTRFGIKRAGRKVEEDDGESELDTTDQLIDDNGDETNPPRGRSTQRRARSTSRSPGESRVKQEQVDELEDDDYGFDKSIASQIQMVEFVSHARSARYDVAIRPAHLRPLLEDRQNPSHPHPRPRVAIQEASTQMECTNVK
ncbi:hypothetical protein EDD15DRAFT_2201926 [Pisolithus albus]|nr:hypothetical protein EDD15DRAFT_2201926 [Pisolithus albus]